LAPAASSTAAIDAARAVDVELNVLVRILRLEEQHLGDREVRNPVVDRRPDEDDAVLQEPRENVVCAFTAVGLFDHHRHKLSVTHSWSVIRDW
jgi:hypothetical protein